MKKSSNLFFNFEFNFHIITLSETWSEKGCSVIKSSVDNTTCSCNHTTHFALLMKFSGSKVSK